MVTAYFFVLGLIFGSFANAAIWRINVGRSISKGRSVCPGCDHILGTLDLIPVISWLWLKGKCRYCQIKISTQYPLVELLTGVLFAMIWRMLTPHGPLGWVNLVFWLYIAVSMVILAVYDLKWQILPDVVLIPAIVVAAIHLPVLLLFHQPLSVIRGPLIAALGAGSGFYTLAAVSKGRWMGGGDIKLVFLMGLLLGIKASAVAMFLATMAAALIGGLLLITKQLKTHYIAFGPFLAVFTFVALFYAQTIIRIYLHYVGLDY